MNDAFFRRLDTDRWVAGGLTRGPWSFDHQHGGPPSALLARALEAAAAPRRVVRITLDLLRPVPLGELSLRVEPAEGGARVRRLRGVLLAEGREVLRAEALALRVAEDPVPPHGVAGLSPGPEGVPPAGLDFFPWEEGYHRAVEARYVRGAWGEASVGLWMRQRVPLVAGEVPSPLQRTLVLADAASGITAALPIRRWTWLNPDLTVTLHRPPEGEWIGMEATMLAEGNGSGLVRTTLHDRRGPTGGALQTLLVAPR